MESIQQPCPCFSFSVRAARLTDLNDLADLLVQSFHSQTGVWSLMMPLFRLGIYEDLKYRLKSDNDHYVCFVAINGSDNGSDLSNSQVIGGVEMALRSRDFWQPIAKQQPYLSNLAVRAEYRQRGVAQRLLRASEHCALDWGFQDLYLHVLEDNKQARRLYQKAGYRVQRFESGLLSWLAGRPRQILLHKHLVSPQNHSDS